MCIYAINFPLITGLEAPFKYSLIVIFIVHHLGFHEDSFAHIRYFTIFISYFPTLPFLAVINRFSPPTQFFFYFHAIQKKPVLWVFKTVFEPQMRENI